ncbi:early activation antigen CD69-like [Rattus rattus]|uniref:early activation antigen CD69-like n=1 Tax=Rattus rattus TaxID=10117 RepID=UPI0013F3154E|nr:early activation antigen CD69-like [Rattus rattus]
MQTESSLRLSQASHHRLTFDLKKVMTLWILVVGVIAVLLWGFFSFPKKFTVTKQTKIEVCSDEVKICLHGWNKLNRNCFTHFSHENSWFTAKETCKFHDATLAVFNDQTELDTVMKQMEDIQTFWIGLYKKDFRGPWVWTNGSKYNNWYDIQDYGHCAFLHKSGIDSTNCNDLKEYICTKEGQCP